MATDRIAELKTPLPQIDGDAALLFSSLEGFDEISTCFRFDIAALSLDPELVANDLLGQSITVEVRANADDEEMVRYFNGIVDRFRFEGNDDADLFKYRLIVRPKLWLLSKTTDNRIFQEMKADEIISQVLDEHGVSDYEWKLRGSPEIREYCVQYGETDLDFIQRLMEFEGIFYYFTYEDGKHTLVMCDDPFALSAAPQSGELRFEPNDLASTEGVGVITRFRRTDSIVSGAHTLQDYNFETPSADLTARMQNPKGHEHDAFERYHYPGRYQVQGHGDILATIRNEEDQARAHKIVASGTASMPASGNLFSLFDYPRAAENIEYMILRVDYDIWDGQYLATARDRDEGFKARYCMVPSDAHFRPAQKTPKPVMKGPQTAEVVGPAGEEIYTDEYSRVKVQFHWDRLGGKDENSTCFIRVSSVWAGAGWGFIQIPRIGQEVIVDFLEGDPDRPIITGRVYNAEQMPPYGLPGNATQSGWKSNSSPGGGGWNELMFEDKAGEELVYFQAQKDHDELIKNNETRNIGNDWIENVGNDATQSVGNNRTESVAVDKSTEVGNNRTVSIGVDDTESVGSNRSLTVGLDETISVGVNSTENIGMNHAQTVGANQTITVAIARVDSVGAAEARTVGAAQTNAIGGTRSVTVGATQSHNIASTDSWNIGGAQSVSVAKDQSASVGGNQTVQVAGDVSVSVGKSAATKVTDDMAHDAGKAVVIKAGDSITLSCGDASLVMKKDGTIVLKGKDLTFKGSGKINVQASSDITMKGSKINQN